MTNRPTKYPLDATHSLDDDSAFDEWQKSLDEITLREQQLVTERTANAETIHKLEVTYRMSAIVLTCAALAIRAAFANMTLLNTESIIWALILISTVIASGRS